MKLIRTNRADVVTKEYGDMEPEFLSELQKLVAPEVNETPWYFKNRHYIVIDITALAEVVIAARESADSWTLKIWAFLDFELPEDWKMATVLKIRLP